MIDRPRFRSHFTVRVLDPGTVFLVFETGFFQIRGVLYTLLTPLIDGQNTARAIAEQLKDQLTFADVRFGLEELEREGWIVAAEEEASPATAAFRDYLGIDPKALSDRLDSTLVSVQSLDSSAGDKLSAMLSALGVHVADRGHLIVTPVKDYLDARLADLNRQRLSDGQPWMLVKPAGIELWVGPVFHPSRSGCWECLAQRVRDQKLRQVLDQTSSHREHPCLSVAALPSTTDVALNVAASEVWKWIANGGGSELEQHLLTLNVQSMTLEKHRLFRRESCPACGCGSRRQPHPVALVSRKKAFRADGGHRSATPDKIWESCNARVSRVLGIVEKLECRSTGPVNVYTAVHNFPFRSHRSALARLSRGWTSAGKGMTDMQAKTSAVCEALERYSGIYRGDEPTVRSTYAAVADSAIHPGLCLQISEEQYSHRNEWNERESEFNWIPERFDPEKEIDWTPAWSLSTCRFRYVPSAWCFYDYPHAADHDFCRADSNGNAAGANVEEAILQGFMELVERDSVALWWYNRLRRPAVDLTSFRQPYFSALQQHYKQLGRDIRVLDLTSDLRIPVCAAVSRGMCGDVILGFGAHFDAAIAVSRALTEMNQFLAPVLEGRTLALWHGEWPNEDFLQPDISAGLVQLSDYTSWSSDDLRTDIDHCVELAESRGLEVLVVDQTHSDVGLAVVKVIVPGMRPHWARFAPGRIYTVPVEMGWLSAPLRDSELNPAHLSM